jgi:hypothetical protein
MILDSQVEALRGIQGEMLGVLGELRQEIDLFRSSRQICGRLNLLSLTNEADAPKMRQKPKRENQVNGEIKVNIIKPS